MRIRDVSAPDRLLTPARGGALLVIGILVLAFNLRAAITSLPPVFPELAVRAAHLGLQPGAAGGDPGALLRRLLRRRRRR